MDRFSVGAQLAKLGLSRDQNESESLSEPVWLDGTATGEEHAVASDVPKSILKRSEEGNRPRKPSAAKVTFGAADSFSAEAAAANPAAVELLKSMHAKHADGVVVSTNFGPNSAVILHLATRVNPNIPIVWVDTGYLSDETYLHAEQLTALLNLNLQVYQPVMSRARMEAIHGKLWETNEKEFGRLRKVEPMKRALSELKVKASVVGLRRSQLGHSGKSVTRVSKDGNERFRVLPIFDWSDADVANYITEHGLPSHGDATSGPRRDALRYAEHGINACALAKGARLDLHKETGSRGILLSISKVTTTTAMAKSAVVPDLEVEIYTRINSALCKSTKKLLEEKNVDFMEYVVGIDIAEDTLLTSIGGSTHSAPYVFVGGEYVGGFNEVCERLGEDPRRHATVWGRNVSNVQVGLV